MINELEDGRSEATFRFTVHNFRQMKYSVLSPPCYVRNLPWRILVMPRNAADPEKQKSLGFFLQCNPDTDSDSWSWSCNASAELRLLSYKPDTNSYSRKIQHLFSGKENDWGFSNFIAWNDVLNEDEGYVKDNSITLEVHVIAEAPNGITTDSEKQTPRNDKDQDQETKIVNNKNNHTMVEEENKCNAEKCLQIAEGAFQSGNYEKAERLLLKAERLYPTTIAKQMLKDIKYAKNKDVSPQESEDTGSYNSESSNTTFSGEYYRTDEDKKTAETCIEIAESAISKGNFDKAKNFLLKSVRIFPSDLAKDLLKDIDDLKRNFSPTSYSNGTTSRSSLGNKDEAEKCIQIAEAEFSACRLARAERLLHKAERLCPTARAKDLLRQIEDAIAKGVKDTDERKPYKPRQSRQENERQRQNQDNERPKRQGPTAEQVEAIRRVKESKDDFEILGLQKQCTPGEVKKAFRRLTLLLHPDKNKAPGAKEAFMMASEASERLRKKRQTNDA